MINLEKCKELLEARLAKLTGKASEIDQALRDPGSPDWEDHATEVESEEVLEDMGKAVLGEINQIKSALQRIDIGTYGECTRCGETIDKKRLKALPFTANCVDCAREAEG